MSGDRHLARMLQLQRMHALLLRRQAGTLVQAEAAERGARDRVQRLEALLGDSAVAAGPRRAAVLAGGATLRGLLVGALAAAEERVTAATGARQSEAQRWHLMEIRAERIAGRVADARREALARDAARQTTRPLRATDEEQP